MQGGADPDNRRDFPGGWPGDPRNAFESRGRTTSENAIFDHVRKLTALRSELEPLRRGKMISLTAAKQSWAYVRETNSAAVVVLINNTAVKEPICIRLDRNGDFHGRLALGSDLRIRDGAGCADLAPRSAEIYAMP